MLQHREQLGNEGNSPNTMAQRIRKSLQKPQNASAAGRDMEVAPVRYGGVTPCSYRKYL